MQKKRENSPKKIWKAQKNFAVRSNFGGTGSRYFASKIYLPLPYPVKLWQD